MVVHLREHTTEPVTGDPVRRGGPRFGLIVSKAVGNAVIRHRTSRRLRRVCAGLIDTLPATADIVIRALPRSAEASSEQLARDVRRALRKLGALDNE